MSVRMEISLVIYMMVQGVLFGIAVVALLASPISSHAMQALPWIVSATAIASVPLSWIIAPRLRAFTEIRFAGRRRPVSSTDANA